MRWRVFSFYPGVNRYESVSCLLDHFEACVLASALRFQFPSSSFIVLPY